MKKLLFTLAVLLCSFNTASALEAVEVVSNWEKVYTVGNTTYYVDTKHIYHRSWSEWTTGFVREKSPTGSKIYMLKYLWHTGGDTAEIWTLHVFDGDSMDLGNAVVHDFHENKGITKGQKNGFDHHLSKIKGFKLTVLTFFEDFLLYRADEVIFLEKNVKVRTPNYPYIGAEIM